MSISTIEKILFSEHYLIGILNFFLGKLGTQGKRDPPQNQILMGVIACAFFDLRSCRGPQRLLENKKMPEETFANAREGFLKIPLKLFLFFNL